MGKHVSQKFNYGKKNKKEMITEKIFSRKPHHTFHRNERIMKPQDKKNLIILYLKTTNEG